METGEASLDEGKQDAQAQHLARKACKSASRKGLKGNRGAF